MPKDNPRLHIFESVFLFVVLVSISSLFLLVLNRFSSINAVLLGSIVFVFFSAVFKFKFALSDERFGRGIFIILIVALFFRAEPYLWVMGGQDQGIYVNMSATYERTGSTFITDEVRENIDSAKIRDYYDTNNQMNIRMVREKQYEGEHLPGVYIKDLSESEYVFQFYPLHSIWMAIFGKFLGTSNRVYSLVFFSFISIVAFYLLGFELSGEKKLPGYLAAAFLAVNPLHAYFSKFPVSEVVFLAFSSSAFYFLVRYYKDSLKGRIRPFYLFLSAGLMACLFFTRISGFMYIPLFYLLLLTSVLFKQRGGVRKQFITYVLAVFGLYGISVLYGLTYSYPYSRDIYWLTFAQRLGGNWGAKLSLLAVLAVLPLIAVSFSKSRKLKSYLQKIAILLRNNLHLILYAVILLASYRAYQLGFTTKFVGTLADVRWHVANLGWRSILFSNLFVAILYLSPFAFLLVLLAANYFRKKKSALTSSLLVFLAAFGLYALVIKFITPYQYYYARYLLSELLPYSLLLASLYLGYLFSKTRLCRVAAYLLTGLIFAYSLFFTSFQLLGRGADGADTALERVQARMDEGDLLLILKEGFPLHPRIATPLSYYYGLNIFSFGEAKDMLTVLQGTVTNYGDIFVLSQIPIESSLLNPVTEVTYRVGTFKAKRARPPTEFRYSDLTLFLYKVDKTNLVSQL